MTKRRRTNCVEYERYEEGSWDAWDGVMVRRQSGMATKEDATVDYWPTPEEIRQRAALVRRLRDLPLPELYRHAMFVCGDPEPEEFVQVVDGDGLGAAIERYRDRMELYREGANAHLRTSSNRRPNPRRGRRD